MRNVVFQMEVRTVSLPLIRIDGNYLYVHGVELRRHACVGMGNYAWKPAHDQHILKAAVSPNRQHVVTLAKDGTMMRWNLCSTREDKSRYAGWVRDAEKISAIAMSDNGSAATAVGNAIAIHSGGRSSGDQQVDLESVAALQWFGDVLVARDAVGTEALLFFEESLSRWQTVASPKPVDPATAVQTPQSS